MWEEERVRGEGVLPERPSSPPRSPRPLCTAVEAVRQEYRVGALVRVDHRCACRWCLGGGSAACVQGGCLRSVRVRVRVSQLGFGSQTRVGPPHVVNTGAATCAWHVLCAVKL